MENIKKWKNNKDFRVLLVYPNIQMSALMPLSIGLFTALLKQEQYTVDLFDCTFYLDGSTDDTNQEKVKNHKVLSYDWSERGVVPKTGMNHDFIKLIDWIDVIYFIYCALFKTFHILKWDQYLYFSTHIKTQICNKYTRNSFRFFI